MKRLLIGIIKFSVIPLVIFCAFELTISFLKNKLTSENKLEGLFNREAAAYKWINSMESDSIVLLSGSSSVRYGLSCTVLNDISSNGFQYVNIAMDARDPIETYFILANLDLSKVATVYFGLDPWIYSKRYYKFRNSFFYLDFSPIEVLRYAYEHDKSALVKRYKNLLGFIFNKEEKQVEYGRSPIPSDYGSVALNRVAINFDTPPADWFQLKKYSWSNLQFEYLRKIDQLCEANNVNFALFIPPKRSDFSRAYQATCQTIHTEYVTKLIDHEITAPIFGRFDQLDAIGDSVYFAEAYHLNKEGQQKYSELFYEMTLSDHPIFNKNYHWFIENDEFKQ